MLLMSDELMMMMMIGKQQRSDTVGCYHGNTSFFTSAMRPVARHNNIETRTNNKP